MKKMKKQLVELLNIYGVSGQETKVRSYVKPILEKLMDNVHIDHYGNLLGVKQCGDGNGATVLLSAHMDTVRGVREDKVVIEENGVFTAVLPDGERGVLGADDRAGIAIILAVLRNIPKSFNGTIKVAFSREEEIGCIGASKIGVHFYEGADLAIVVDRRGSKDIVVGCGNAFCSNEVGIFMENIANMLEMNYSCVEGGISDALVFSEVGVNSINLSAGYMNEHTANEYLVYDSMKDTVRMILQAIAVINFNRHKFGSVPSHNDWVLPYTNTNKWYYTYDKDLDVPTAEEVMFVDGEDANSDILVYTDDSLIVLEQSGNVIELTVEQLSAISQAFLSVKK